MKKLIRRAITLLLGAGMLFTLAACGPANGGSPSASNANGTAGPDALGGVSSCGTHNGQPFYIGYTDNFDGALAGFTEVNLSEDAEQADGAAWVAVYVPGGSTRVAVVNIIHDEEDDSFFPLNNVGWAKLGSGEYLSFAAEIPEGTPNLAVVVYSDDWETQQAFALRHNAATGLELMEVTLDG